MKRILKPVLVIVGTLSVALGILGIFLPILPTTPFLLLAAACYARSSDKFLGWLLYNRWFGAFLRDYRAGRGIPRWVKVGTLFTLWVTIGLSAGFAVPVWWAKILLIAVGVAVTVHLLVIGTLHTSSQPAASIHNPEAEPRTSKDT